MVLWVMLVAMGVLVAMVNVGGYGLCWLLWVIFTTGFVGCYEFVGCYVFCWLL